jgi:germination protein M
MAQAESRRRVSLGVLFWIALILLVLVVFLANRSNIAEVLDSTGLVNVLRDRFTADSEVEDLSSEPVVVEPVEEDPRQVVFDTAPTDVVSEPEAAPLVQSEPALTERPRKTPAAETAREEPVVETVRQPSSDPVVQRAPSPDPTKPNRLMADLYFITVNSDGRIHARNVVRPVYYDSSPLTETINALIAGPTGDELDSGLLNLIPEGTALLSAHVEDGVAYLNFNQAFRFNSMGAEGTVAQLLQIIYSSTEFPTVDSVQFLVEGEQLEYLTGEGIYIGEPLGRDTFG